MSGQPPAPGRWARYVNRHVRLDLAWQRLVSSLPAGLQITVAAVAAYAIAHYGLGHPVPLLAVTVTVSSLGFVRDARPIRVLETAVGMSVGIALAELLLLGFGQGLWQLGVALFLSLMVARFLSGSAAFAIAAGVQAVLVMLIAAPPGGPFIRTVDGLIGGAVALLATALIPRDPRRVARRDARRLFHEFGGVLTSLVSVLHLADQGEADRALARARATQPVVDDWRGSLESAIAIARISPFLRRYLGQLESQRTLQSGMDLATRNLRVVTRRIDYLIVDGEPRPALADLLSRVLVGVAVLGQSIDDISQLPVAQQTFRQLARHLDPAEAMPGAPVTEQNMVLLLRPLVVDLLAASGVPVTEARELLPPL
ncbi:hypothetical protein SAMN06309945_0886 [Okibacterium fritillariae]|uniref:Integral membrane bound transporter domain-containing protein n=1 Tax=Okibacterium fritillariae TaxID=123320 RepID=A0A1T5IVG5_9MICO|nr:hypothetical protein SAMN06309945_0886 [Okibacterium fritillariae]